MFTKIYPHICHILYCSSFIPQTFLLESHLLCLKQSLGISFSEGCLMTNSHRYCLSPSILKNYFQVAIFSQCTVGRIMLPPQGDPHPNA